MNSISKLTQFRRSSCDYCSVSYAFFQLGKMIFYRSIIKHTTEKTPIFDIKIVTFHINCSFIYKYEYI